MSTVLHDLYVIYVWKTKPSYENNHYPHTVSLFSTSRTLIKYLFDMRGNKNEL